MMTIDEIFKFMMDREAWELHMVPGSPLMYRDKKGKIGPVDANTITPADTKKIVLEVLNEEQKAEFSQKMQIMIAHSIPGLSRYRMNIFMQRNSISLVINTVPPSPPNIDELNLPPIVKNLADKVTRGMILVVGPKGSGKAHTLSAMINHILETRTSKIVTLENPIRFLFKNKKGIICQREVGIDAKDYTEAFEQLPLLGADIIVVNEIETFAIAHKLLTLAAGGQLVYVSAVAPNCQIVLEKLIDLYPEGLKNQCKTLMAVGIEAVMAMTLLKKINEDALLPVVEVMIATGPVKAFLKEGKIFNINNIMSTTGREIGMTTQEQALRGLVKKNIITQDEAYSKCVRQEEFRKVMALPF